MTDPDALEEYRKKAVAALAKAVLARGRATVLEFIKEQYRRDLRSLWNEFGGWWSCEFEEYFAKQSTTIVLDTLIRDAEKDGDVE